MSKETNEVMQTEMFPMTPVERAELFLRHFQADVEKAVKALDSASIKLADARKLRDVAEQNLALAQKAEEKGLDTVARTIAADMKRTAEEAGISMSFRAGGQTVVIAEPPVVDPDTGEVMSENERQGEAISQTPHVLVWWPGDLLDGELHMTEVGEHTTYGELVADYLTAAGIDAAVEEYRVVRVEGGLECNLQAVIVAWDYGQEFAIHDRLSLAELLEREANPAQEPAA